MEITDVKQIRPIVRAEMRRQNISYYKLAQLTGISNMVFSNYSNGKHELSFLNTIKVLKSLNLKITIK